MENILKDQIELAKEKLLDLINKHKDNTELHADLKDVFEAVSFKPGDIEPLTAGCNGAPMPTNQPTTYGHWSCTASGWVWIPEFGD